MRYSRQETLGIIGKSGQRKLADACVTIIGVGALGTTSTELLVRAGIGSIVLVDNEKIELSNLQRQTLFTEKDVGSFKAEAAAKHLKKINSAVKINVFNEYLNKDNLNKILYGLILDCTDNLHTRFLINEYCKKKKRVWIHAAAIKTKGVVFVVRPDAPCLRCFISRKSDVEKCEDVGVLNTITTAISSMQVTEALKLFTGKACEKNIIRFDIWKGEFEKIKIKNNKKCDVCNGIYELLDKKPGFTIKLCKSKAVYEVQSSKNTKLNLKNIKKAFDVEIETPILLVLKNSGGIIVHNYGKLVFKKLRDEKKIKNLAEKIYNLGK